KPLDANDGFTGAVVLCLEIPDAVLAQYDVSDELQASSGYRLALIPAATLNELGKPQVYDHSYASLSRVELVRAIRKWSAGERRESIPDHVKEMREAVAFLDEMGWLAPLRVREESKEN